MLERINKAQTQQLLSGETVTISTSIVSSNGSNIHLECYIIPSPYKRKWILVTAFAGQVAVGFVDGMFYGEYNTSKIESPHVMRVSDPNFSHTEIRYEAGDDGLYVIESERKLGVGREMMSTIRAIFKGLGAKVLFVNQPKESAEVFYTKLGLEKRLGAFQEVFDNEEGA